MNKVWLKAVRRRLNQPDAKRQLLAIVVLLIILVICNLSVTSTDGWAKAAWISFGYVGFFFIYQLARLRPDDIGLNPQNLRTGLRYFAITAGLIGFVLILTALFDDQIFHDPRYDNNFGNALLLAFILIPLKTVIFEEFAFRGLLAGLSLKLSNSSWTATLVSSMLFGIWHVRSAGSIGSYNIGGDLVIGKPLVLCGILLITTLAGVVLCALRWRSKSLLAPVGAHWAINSFAVLLAALTWH